MVMFLLSLQTGLIDMEMPHRLGAMSVILFIVAASLFQVRKQLLFCNKHFFHCIKGWKLTGDLLCYFYIIDNFRSDSSCIASLICVLSTLVPSCENSSFMRNHLFCSRLHEPSFGWDCWARLMDYGSHFK